MKVLLALAAAMTLGCHPPRTVPVASDWRLGPAQVVFAPTPWSQRGRAEVVLRNDGQRGLTVTMSTRAPFSVSVSSLTLSAGAEVTLGVDFASSLVGAVKGQLSAQVDDTVQWVELDGEALAPAPSTGCDEGAPCSTPCLEHGRCTAGVCLGQARDCSDGDACTDDACEPSTGCLHMAVRCAGGDGCHAATCDRRLGCTATELPDGARCGAADCLTSQVCLAGTCVSSPTPEGVSCGAGSPCQTSSCRAGACEPGATQVLRASWAVSVPEHTEFSGAADAAGALYWVECAPDCTLVSVTADGADRYREALLGTWLDYGGQGLGGGLAVVDAAVVLLSADGYSVEAHSAASGALLWARHLVGDELRPHYPAACALTVENTRQWSLASDGAGHLALAIVKGTLGCIAPGNDVWVLSLEAATGDTRWVQRYGVVGAQQSPGRFAQAPTLAFDEQGALYASLRWPTFEDQTLLSLAADGSTRWQRTWPSGAYTVAGLARGQLLLAGAPAPSLLLDTATGATGTTWLPLSGEFTALMTADAVLAFSSRARATELVRWSPGSGLAQTTGLSDSVVSTQAALTSRDSVVLGLTRPGLGGASSLAEFGTGGERRFECELDLPLDGERQPVLSNGRWVTLSTSPTTGFTVRSYAAAGAALATGGWVTGRGQLTQAGRPR